MSITIQKIYNPLIKLGRRIKENMASIKMSVSMLLIPLAFAFLIWAEDHRASSDANLFLFLCAVCFASGIALWGDALNNARKERKEDIDRHKESEKSMRNLVAALNSLVEEIKTDKEERTSKKK